MVKKCAYFKGFTLAEVMIVLTVIGVLTAILLPVARQSMPDENLMKFKKVHNTLGTVIRELVTSDKYYLDGDLGRRPNGDLIDGTHEGDNTYFCNTFADITNSKEYNCENSDLVKSGWVDLNTTTDDDYENMDTSCALVTKNIGIILLDGVNIYEFIPNCTFGMSLAQAHNTSDFETPSTNTTTRAFGGYIADGFDKIYKIICMDIDGIGLGEAPFGYGVRVDGKIIAGKRAQQWLEREVNEE